LRARHPRVEFESCASGGGRIDHGILGRTVRVWTSDCNDPLERQAIQRGASLFVPNEMLGAHVGPRVSHTTGRTSTMGFRAATALFGWMGVECNLLEIRDDDREVLARAIAAHKRHRGLLHSGDVVRFDTDDDAVAHGVYAADRSEALVCYAQVASSAVSVPTPWRLPGLDPAAVYELARVDLDGPPRGGGRSTLDWLSTGLRATGRDLAAVGLPLPPMWPETALVVHLQRQ
jgi:alpha-galactosidase